MREEHLDRIVKIPLPVRLIRQIDEALVAGLGGYSTRTEFFREAAEGLLLELQYEHAPAEPLPSVRATAALPASRPDAGQSGLSGPGDVDSSARLPAGRLMSLEQTALRLAEEGYPIDGQAQVDDEPLFGMHNRDFPSLWAAYGLARRARTAPVPYDAFVDDITAEAWEFAAGLEPLEESGRQKLTALFPTNRDKPQSSADAFKAFAVGSVTNGRGGPLRADGPLFAWRVGQVVQADGQILFGLTTDGWRLLRELDGISLELPHPQALAWKFFDHLRRLSPGDWWGFRRTLEAVADDPTRPELVQAFQDARPDWSSNVAATNAQGYLARAREWGLVQPKQVVGRYALTDFGSEVLAAQDDTSSSPR
jgi:hypothetical protein